MNVKKAETATEAQLLPDEQASDPPAWEEIESGRFQPRRIRGSCRGRVLG